MDYIFLGLILTGFKATVVYIFHRLLYRELFADSHSDSECDDELPEDKRKRLFNERNQAAINLNKCKSHKITFYKITVYHNLKQSYERGSPQYEYYRRLHM